MTAAAATATLLFRAGQKIGLAFRTAAEAARDLSDNIDVSSAQTAYRDLQRDIQSLTDQITKGESGNWLQRQIVALQQVFDKDYQEQKRILESEQRSFRDQIAQQERLNKNNQFIKDFNAAIDRLERLQRDQTGPFGVGQIATFDAILGVLQEINSKGRRF